VFDSETQKARSEERCTKGFSRIKATQKRVFRIIFDASKYLDFCIANDCTTMHVTRDILSRHFFTACWTNLAAYTFYLISEYSDRTLLRINCAIFKLPHVRTTRFSRPYLLLSMVALMLQCCVRRLSSWR